MALKRDNLSAGGLGDRVRLFEAGIRDGQQLCVTNPLAIMLWLCSRGCVLPCVHGWLTLARSSLSHSYVGRKPVVVKLGNKSVDVPVILAWNVPRLCMEIVRRLGLSLPHADAATIADRMSLVRVCEVLARWVWGGDASGDHSMVRLGLHRKCSSSNPTVTHRTLPKWQSGQNWMPPALAWLAQACRMVPPSVWISATASTSTM